MHIEARNYFIDIRKVVLCMWQWTLSWSAFLTRSQKPVERWLRALGLLKHNCQTRGIGRSHKVGYFESRAALVVQSRSVNRKKHQWPCRAPPNTRRVHSR